VTSRQGKDAGIDRLLFYNHQSLHATLRYPGAMAIAEQRLADQESSPHHRLVAGALNASKFSQCASQSPYPLSSQLVSCINTPRTVVRGIHLNPAGRHPGRAARMQISAGGRRKPTLGGTAGGHFGFGRF
jgi:hypothetical protein